MSKKKAASTLKKTRNFDFLFGHYSYSARTIPYFQITMTFQDAADYLDLVDEMPGSSEMDWRIEELFQRDIEWDRVEKGLVPYLISPDHPQFFNSITIALIPKKGTAMKGFGEGDTWHPPKLEDEKELFDDGMIKDFGPLRCGYWDQWSHYTDDAAKAGQLAWNLNETVGVAIDGQHRLAAIKEIARTSSNAHLSTTLPVILVVLEPQLGFDIANSYQETLQTLRRLFIDLNKHARTVRRARQILLDDRDPVSICVRTLVGPQLQNGLDELQDSPPRLPLSLVDWHTEQAKFDEGPYLATILGLDWIVSQLLNIKPMESGVDYSALAKSIDRLETATKADLSEAKARLEQSEKLQRPFSLLGGEDVNELDELGAIAEGFARHWAPSIIYILTGFEPYARLVKERKTAATACPEFANWYALKAQIDNAKGQVVYLKNRMADLTKDLSERSQDPISVVEYTSAVSHFEDIKAEHELAFTVVFQRALFMAFNRFSSVSTNMIPGASGDSGSTDLSSEMDDLDAADEGNEEAADGWAENGEQEARASSVVDKRAQQLVSAMNELLKSEVGFLDKDFEFHNATADAYERFWHSSFMQPDGSIDFTQAASKRAHDLILMVALMWLIRETEGRKSFADFISRVENATTGLYLKVQQSISRMTKENSIGDKILRAREEVNRTEQKRLAQITPRVRWLWDIIGSDSAE